MKSYRSFYGFLVLVSLYLVKSNSITATPSLTLSRFAQAAEQKSNDSSSGTQLKQVPTEVCSHDYQKLVPEIIDIYYKAGLISLDQKAHLQKNAEKVLPIALPALRSMAAGQFLVSHELMSCLIRHGATPRDTFHDYAPSGLAAITSTTVLTALLKRKASLSRTTGITATLLATYPVLAFYKMLERSIDQARTPARAAQALPFVSLANNGFTAAREFYKEQGSHEQFRLSFAQRVLLDGGHVAANTRYLFKISLNILAGGSAS